MFAAWMIGFLVLMAALVWAAVVVGLPQPWIGLVVLILVGLGLAIAITAWRRRMPPPGRR